MSESTSTKLEPTMAKVETLVTNLRKKAQVYRCVGIYEKEQELLDIAATIVGLECENSRLRELLLDVADVLGKNEKLRELANRLRRAASDGVDNACEVFDENAKLQETLQRRTEQFEGMTEMWVERGVENAKLRELCRRFAEYVSHDRCEGCVCKRRCNDGEIEECWQRTEIREIAHKLGIEVDE